MHTLPRECIHDSLVKLWALLPCCTLTKKLDAATRNSHSVTQQLQLELHLTATPDILRTRAVDLIYFTPPCIKGVRVLKRQGRGGGVLIGKCQIRKLASVANGVP